MFSLLGKTDQVAGTTARRISRRRFNPAFVEASAKSGDVSNRNRFWERSSTHRASRCIGKTGLPTTALALLSNLEVDVWYLPLSITLEMKRTRTSWQLTIRIQFIF